MKKRRHLDIVDSKDFPDLSVVLGGEDSPYRKIEDERWSEVPFWCSTGSLYLDYALGGMDGKRGGIAACRATEIWGPEQTCKSTVLDLIIREFLKRGAVVLLGDKEHSRDGNRILELWKDTNPQLFRFIQKPPEEGKTFLHSDFTLQEFFDYSQMALEKIRKSDPDRHVLIALDSLAATDVERTEDGDYKVKNMKDRLGKSQYLSDVFGPFCDTITSNNATLIIINQARVKPGVAFGDPNYSPGGSAKGHLFSVRIQLSGHAKIKAKDDPLREHRHNHPIGICSSFTIVKNRLAAPFRQGKLHLYFDDRGMLPSVDLAAMIEGEIQNPEKECPLQKKGGWYSWKDEKIGQGFPGLVRAFEEDKNLLEEVERELFGYRDIEEDDDDSN